VRLSSLVAFVQGGALGYIKARGKLPVAPYLVKCRESTVVLGAERSHSWKIHLQAKGTPAQLLHSCRLSLVSSYITLKANTELKYLLFEISRGR